MVRKNQSMNSISNLKTKQKYLRQNSLKERAQTKTVKFCGKKICVTIFWVPHYSSSWHLAVWQLVELWRKYLSSEWIQVYYWIIFVNIFNIITRLTMMNIKRCFNTTSLNCLSLALLILICASLQTFRLRFCNLSQNCYLIYW